MDDEPVFKKQLHTERGGSGRKGKTAVGSGDGGDFEDSHRLPSDEEPLDEVKRLRAVICDRSTWIQRGFAAMMFRLADVVGSSNDGETAIAMIQNLQPDFVVMDFDLEKMNCLEVMNKVKLRMPSLKTLIATDSYSATKYFHQLFRAGATGICMKSSGQELFLDAVKKVIANESYCEPQILNLIKQTPDRAITLQLSADEVAVLVRLDLRNKEIAEELDMPLKSVERYIESILIKLNQPSRTGAALVAVHAGFVLLPKMPRRDPITGLTDEHVAAEKQAQEAIRRWRQGESQQDA
jgi:DNA-binding NarL/FixJ family response regulator